MSSTHHTARPGRIGRTRPASYAQGRLWFLDRLEGAGTHYNISRVVDLRGALDCEALRWSFETLVERHEALRTCFSEEDGEPVQTILPSLDVALSVVDLSGLAPSVRDTELGRLTQQALDHVFDLRQTPLFRWHLLQLDREQHRLILVFHHILSDGWSLSIFNRELASLYAARVRGEPATLPDLPIQYADYAVWQRGWLQGDVLREQVDYWRRQLDGVTELSLPMARPPEDTGQFVGALEHLPLSDALTSSLKTLSRGHGATLFMTLLTAFQLLLGRLSGHVDVAVGAPVAGRNRPEIEGILGCFVNTLVLRSDLSGRPTFGDLLKRARIRCLDAYAHQDLPFERLVELLKPERDLGRTPFFDIMINLSDRSFDAFSLSGLDASALELDARDSKLPLTLYIVPTQDQSSLELRAAYQVARFDACDVRALLQQYRYLLQQIVDDPDRPASQYSLVTPECQPLLPDPETALAVSPRTTVVRLFARRVDEYPGHSAVVRGDRTWTYLELARAAAGVARGLREAGMAAGDVIAVTGDRNFGLVAGILGVLACGGVLLLIDPSLPRQRRDLMLTEARARLRLAAWDRPDSPADSDTNSDADIPMLPLGPDDGSLLGASADRIPEAHLPAGPRPDQAAYIIYTSGSTGMPKGVLGVHQGLAHFVDWQRTEFGIGPGDRVGLLTGYGFDVVLRDLFLPLTSGATLCLPEDEAPTDPVSWLDTQGITVLHTVPSLAQSWLADDLGDHRLSDMRWIFMAGEPLTGSLVADWRRAFPEAGRMVNLYGPTETTLAKSFYRVPTSCGSGVLPVGWPIPESQGLVLNDDMQPCGTGEAGEVYVRTPFRSRGYVSRPDETRLRFIDNPFGSASGDLLYRTGDRGHYRPDGALVVTGRLDDQVKIRGVRVEPAEVGAVLARHECVAAGTVQATTDEQGETSLVAYVVPNVDPGGLEAGLRAFLGKHLPSAMVPREFVWLERLPLLPTGKIDRTVLSSAQTGPVKCTTASTPPRDELERRVAAIWATVLERDSVGVDADFFEIGGHSLLATRVLARINDAFGVSLPLRHLFESPTVAELCERLRAQPDTHRTVMEGMDKRPR